MSGTSFDPFQLPIDSVANEPALPAAYLHEQWIRQRFLDNIVWHPEMQGDLGFDITPRKSAAVLILIVMRISGPTILFTKRTANLREHAGQISFPGGRVDPADQHLVDTALRETEEETGIHRTDIDVIGQLPQYETRTGYAITPVVGLIKKPFVVNMNKTEVDEIFEVPLSFLMNGAHHQRRIWASPTDTAQKIIYTIPYERFFIWGATAGMLRNLFHFFRAD